MTRLLGITLTIAFASAPAWAQDAWVSTNTATAPAPTNAMTGVWTGREMIVWGGEGITAGILLNTGARYDPTTDSWTPISTTGAPQPRKFHAAAWTGGEMIIWGGMGSGGAGVLNDGARYNPSTDTWAPMSNVGAPVAREKTTNNSWGIWTGREFIVWGGSQVDTLTEVRSGGRYDPVTDTWTAISTTNAPISINCGQTWTGRELIVWGGGTLTNTGARYDPVTNSWTPTTTTGAPLARQFPCAVWTGSNMIIWGGFSLLSPDPNQGLNDGGLYDPLKDSWSPLSITGAPSPRGGFCSAVWTGREMIIWSGYDGGGPLLNTGGRYDPTSNSWVSTSLLAAPTGRHYHCTVWTGAEMIVWGGETGSGSDSDQKTGGVYTTEMSSRFLQATSISAKTGCAATIGPPENGALGTALLGLTILLLALTARRKGNACALLAAAAFTMAGTKAGLAQDERPREGQIGLGSVGNFRNGSLSLFTLQGTSGSILVPSAIYDPGDPQAHGLPVVFHEDGGVGPSDLQAEKPPSPPDGPKLQQPPEEKMPDKPNQEPSPQSIDQSRGGLLEPLIAGNIGGWFESFKFHTQSPVGMRELKSGDMVMARLQVSASVADPVSVGLFGEWADGKDVNLLSAGLEVGVRLYRGNLWLFEGDVRAYGGGSYSVLDVKTSGFGNFRPGYQVRGGLAIEAPLSERVGVEVSGEYLQGRYAWSGTVLSGDSHAEGHGPAFLAGISYRF